MSPDCSVTYLPDRSRMSQTAGLVRLPMCVIHFLPRENPAIVTTLGEGALRYT